MTSLRISAVLALVAVAAIVAGVVLLVGVAWGLIAAGMFGLAGAVLLYDPAARAGHQAPDRARSEQIERGKPR